MFESTYSDNVNYRSAGARARRKALGELAKAVKARRNEITAEKAARKEAKA